MNKKILLPLLLCLGLLFQVKYFELQIGEEDVGSSLIGLTIDGSSATTFPSKDSGYAIDSIQCDKDATGVWDYENWGLKVRGVHQSRTKCQINFVSRYSENILNGTDPVLKDGLIPVTIDDNGTVKKASLGDLWYDYETQRWANAVILNNETEVYYDGDTIPEEAIESYFVWIPRYKYKLFDQNNGNYTGLTNESNSVSKEQTIEVQFEDKNTTPSTGSTYNSWLTHPAFTAFETNGIWVGKFETGYKGATTKEEAEKNVQDSSKIQIKPNVYSWREIQVANAYLSSYNYKRNLDSHMMKNTEWGAVAYLQHSKYGNRQSVRINNNENYLTGYAVKTEPTCGYTGTNEECNKYETTNPGVDGTYTVNYKNPLSQVASTTGNYSGIYDMSGGSWEYVMGVMTNQSNVPCSGRDATYNSGFNGPYCNTSGSLSDGVSDFPSDPRYYDTYAYSTVFEEYHRRILGDATGEMGPFANKTYGSQTRQVGSWHNDGAWFVVPNYSWFVRGGSVIVGSESGMFNFASWDGSGDYAWTGFFSFRVVLSF